MQQHAVAARVHAVIQQDRDTMMLVRGEGLSHRPRILYVNWVHGEDGSAVHVRETVRELESLGCEVSVVWHRGLPEMIGAPPSTYSRRSPVLAWLLHEPKEIAEGLQELFRELHEARSFQPHWILCRYTIGKWTSAMVSRLLGIPMILEVNSLYDGETVRYGSEYLHYRRIMRLVERLVVRRSKGITVVSNPLKESVSASYGVPSQRVFVNPNGARIGTPLDAEVVKKERAKLGLDQGPLVVFAGSFKRFHGADLLATALDRLMSRGSPASFIMMGEGPTRKAVEALNGRFPNRIVMLGRLPTEECRRVISLCDIGIMPDSNPYGSPIKVVEYMAAGLGVLAPDYPPLRELIDDHACGLLFPPRDVNAFIDHLTLLIENLPLRQRLGEAARERVRMRLSWRHNAERVLGFGLTSINAKSKSCVA